MYKTDTFKICNIKIQILQVKSLGHELPITQNNFYINKSGSFKSVKGYSRRFDKKFNLDIKVSFT